MDAERILDFVDEEDPDVERVFDAAPEVFFDLILVGVRDFTFVFVLPPVAVEESEDEPVEEKVIDSEEESLIDIDSDGEAVFERDTRVDLDSEGDTVSDIDTRVDLD